jgi:hypothetical protein
MNVRFPKHHIETVNELYENSPIVETSALDQLITLCF